MTPRRATPTHCNAWASKYDAFMKPWNFWYHVGSNTKGTWLTGDPRGFRSRHHREHVEGDYRRLSPPAVVMVMCDIVVFALAPCQWRSPALICTTSPTVISRSSCSVATTPVPAVTTRI